MPEYELILEALQNRISNNEISLEFAESVSNIAFDKYFLAEENTLTDAEDIFYNKEKYESGDINLLCIIGYSGGGKSTMSNGEVKFMREVVDMDKIVLGMLHKPDEYYKSLGPFSYSYVTGPGKTIREKYKKTKKDDEKVDYTSVYASSTYRKEVSNDLFHYAEKYSASHKAIRLVIEGVWIYRYINPSDANQYAVYIKGTSLKSSLTRALKRDNANGTSGSTKMKKIGYTLAKTATASIDAVTGNLEKWRTYFSDRYAQQKLHYKVHPIKKIEHISGGILHDIKHGSIGSSTKTAAHSVVKKTEKLGNKIIREINKK